MDTTKLASSSPFLSKLTCIISRGTENITEGIQEAQKCYIFYIEFQIFQHESFQVG